MSQYDEHEEIVTTHGEIRGLRKLKDELDGFTPTADNINRLPQKIRDYIHALETRCDPAGDVAALVLTKDQNRQLAAENAMLRRELGEKIPFMPKAVGVEIRRLQSIITSSLASNGQFRSDVCYAAFGHRDALTDEQIIDSLKAMRTSAAHHDRDAGAERKP